jgi:hypothetical protein
MEQKRKVFNHPESKLEGDIGRMMFRDLGDEQAFEDPAWPSHSILFHRSHVSPLVPVVFA